ncbi:hypothetical protein [Bradyrhizobium roseum]|uniref:hypothetical protein n=1 Tax=Bradyrhizobium roseum TaxID=3056648 RepID=UPI002610BD73|nr:hypothetical protein [Bradyrhizobium roseus]WKA29475.1 hypothetical protein QUH67_04570 [Bradyrhizobium roseus]
MADLRGAFKANPTHFIRRVKELLCETARDRLLATPNDQKPCKKFSQIAASAQKLDSLLPKHTF